MGFWDGRILVAEPKMSVSADSFQKTVDIAQSTGSHVCGHPAIQFNHTALFEAKLLDLYFLSSLLESQKFYTGK